MATTARPAPWCYVTWITGVLSGEKSCWFAPWLRSNFQIDKLERGFDFAAWAVEHTEMVTARARELQTEGWTVFLEAQNDFKLKGELATLSGKCDLVAVRGDEARVEDCKSRQQRNSDHQQVLIYMLALPLLAKAKRPSPMALAVAGKRISGAVVYRDQRVEIRPEELTPAVKQRISDTVKRMGDPTRPPTVPSAAECRFCDVGPQDCQDRIDEPDTTVDASEYF